MLLWTLLFSQSVVSDSLDPMDYSLPGSSSMGFPKQEYWSGLPFSSSGDLPDPGIELASPAQQVDSFTTEPPGQTKDCVTKEQYLVWYL